MELFTPHGVSRMMSRMQAKAQLKLEDYRQSMEGVYSTSVGKDTLYEAPMACKSLSDILDVIGDTVEVIDVIRKVISYQRGENWLDWDINHDYCHADGDPMVPFTAEVAFVSAYNMKFFADKLGYSPVLKKHQRVIDEQLYLRLGI